MRRAPVNAPPSLEPFRFVAPLGSGGFAPVWLAEEAYQGKKLRDVALKLFFLPEGMERGSGEAAEWMDGIVEEARALCRVEHPNVVRFYALHRDDAQGIVGLAMEYVAGRSLDALLDERGPLGDKTVAEAGISVAWALAAVHHAGLVHRDVKPANIIAGRAGYKLIDFGIVVDAPPASRAAGSGSASFNVLSAPPPLIGTRGYIPPEYFGGGSRPTPSGDLYALGATLYALSRGVLPTPDAVSAMAGGRDAGVAADTGPIRSVGELIGLLLDPDPSVRPRHADWVARELMRLHAQLKGKAGGEGSIAVVPPDQVAPSWRETTAEAPATETDEPSRAPAPPRPGRHVPSNAEDIPREPNAAPPLVGRSDALALIEQAAREAADGAPRFVLITGPLGVGRTRLLEAAVELSGAPAERALRLRCSPERKSPLRPLLRAFEALPDGGDVAFGLLKDAVDRALAPAELPGGQSGDEALEAIEDELLWSAKETSVVVAIDDVQWADPPTLKLLQLLLERADHGSGSRLLVVAAARDEPNASPALRALLTRARGRIRAGVRHVPMGPLTAEQAAELAQAVCPLEPALEQAVVRGSGRVPFFVVHALLVWRERGSIQWRSGAWRPASERVLVDDVPGVADLVEARLTACFEPGSAAFNVARSVLSAVGLYGGGLPMETLLDLGLDEESLEPALESLVDAGILEVSGDRQEFGFAQEMVRQAVLNMYRQKLWFRRLERSLLDAVARGPDADADAAFLASGYERLGARDQARPWLRKAIENATAAGLFDEAAALGETLAAITRDPAERIGVEHGTLRALIRGRRFEEAKVRLTRLEALAAGLSRETPEARALDLRRRILRLEVARGLSEAADDAALIADADAAVDPALACEARLALAGVNAGERELKLADEAVALAERVGPALEFSARVLRAELAHTASRRVTLPDPELPERDLRRALAIAVATSSPWQQIHIESDLAVMEAERGQVAQAIDRLRRLTSRAEALRMRQQLRVCSLNLATNLMRAGRATEAAEEALKTAALAAEAGDPVIRGMAYSTRSYALLQAGALEGALESATLAEGIQRSMDDRLWPQTLLRRAEIHWRLGRSDEALADARSAAEVAARQGETGFRLTAALCEVLYLARRGQASGDDLRGAMAAIKSSGVPPRALLKSLMDQAADWLAGAEPTR